MILPILRSAASSVASGLAGTCVFASGQAGQRRVSSHAVVGGRARSITHEPALLFAQRAAATEAILSFHKLKRSSQLNIDERYENTIQ